VGRRTDSDRPRVYRNENNHGGDNHAFSSRFITRASDPLACLSLRSTCVRPSVRLTSMLSEISIASHDGNASTDCSSPPLSLSLSLSLYLSIYLRFHCQLSSRVQSARARERTLFSFARFIRNRCTSAPSVYARTGISGRPIESSRDERARYRGSARYPACKQAITRNADRACEIARSRKK